MTPLPSNVNRPTRRRAIGYAGQHGVTLPITLIVMVVLMLAGIALMRSTDTATIVSGNLGLEQAAMSATDRSVEYAVHALFDTTLIPDRTVDNKGQNYLASVGRNADGSIPEIPKELQDPFTAAGFATAGLKDTLISVDEAGNKSYLVIERMCLYTAANDPMPLRRGRAVGSNCNLSSGSFGADPGTQHYEGLIRPGDAFYRVTIRVEGPRNTVSYVQAMLQ